ncbi:response regulator transcription factor [Nonomuraea sp. MCN248]|uniref:Response regulator transcription factor n=1 Tax=Nonomuraea corallina TaxID=2989783 RepID=A0ABT4S723_9ACTN|nr:response regulator transcription factor [Nonomuraea corallina]MDA0632741.1 response regulator transcription factor [Nonomuraea corallina]
MDDRTTVLIVDDHSLFREGLKELLESDDDIAVVGEAGDSESAVELAASLKPHVVLLDVEIPGDEATTTVSRIQAASPRSEVIILSIYDGPYLVQSLLARNIRGYLLKTVRRAELLAAVRTARTDHDRVMLVISRESLVQVQPNAANPLSARELQVLELVAEALSNGQVASRMNLTESTVKRHLRNVFLKLGAVSRVDAVNKAVAASLIKPPSIPHQP